MSTEEVSFTDVSREAILESLAARHDGVGTVLNLLGRNLQLAAAKCDAWFTRQYPGSTLLRGAASGAAAVVVDMLPTSVREGAASAFSTVHDYGKAYAGEGGAYLGGIAAGVALAEVTIGAAGFAGELAVGAKAAIKAEAGVVREVVSAEALSAFDKHPSTFVGHKGKEIRPVGNINEGAIIEGINYSGHSLDQMQHRGIMPTVVKNTIQTGIVKPGNTRITLRYYDSQNNLTVVINSKTGKVITVYNGDK